jgi:hypothetical protein
VGDLGVDDRSHGRRTGDLDAADLDVAYAFAGSLDQAARVRQVGAVGLLEVDVAGVRDDREQHVTELRPGPEGEEAIRRVDRLDGRRDRVLHCRPEGSCRGRDHRAARREECLELRID